MIILIDPITAIIVTSTFVFVAATVVIFVEAMERDREST